MLMRIANVLFFSILLLTVSACSSFFDTDNSPMPTRLTAFKMERNPRLLWSMNVYPKEATYAKLNPTQNERFIFISHSKGWVSAIEKRTEKMIWKTNTNTTITSSPSVGDNIVVVGSQKGFITALSEVNGNILWRSQVSGEVLAKPAIKNNFVIIKTVNGVTYALRAKDGKEVWATDQNEPSLVLRGASSPIIYANSVIVGFANGELSKYDLYDGSVKWEQTIAIPEGGFPIQRMIDIDADPIIFNQKIYAATYQGSIASLDWLSGRIRWKNKLSSYTGMVGSDDAIFITDAKGSVWSFAAKSGNVLWRQDKLLARVLTAPAVVANEVVVVDQFGFIHWLSKSDGRFVSRLETKRPQVTTPLVDRNILYLYSQDGSLSAYALY